MRTYLSRHEAEEAIMDAAVSRLTARTGDDQSLAGVKDVLRGDAADTNPSTPCIWVGDGETRALQDDRGMQISDRNTFELVIQSEVRDRRAKEGPREARKLASLAGEELLRDEAGNPEYRLGLARWVTNVEFVRSGKGPSSSKTKVFTHGAVYRVTYMVKR